MEQWKKYVGYDQWNQRYAGQEAANPGPVDNSSLLKGKVNCFANGPSLIRLYRLYLPIAVNLEIFKTYVRRNNPLPH